MAEENRIYGGVSPAPHQADTARDGNERHLGDEFIDPAVIERELGIKEQTQAIWRSTNRYGWRDLTVKVGSKVRYRRADVERWLESRTGVAA